MSIFLQLGLLVLSTVIVIWISVNIWRLYKSVTTFALGSGIVWKVQVVNSVVTVLTIGEFKDDQYRVYSTNPLSRLIKVSDRISDMVAQTGFCSHPIWGDYQLLSYKFPMRTGREMLPGPDQERLALPWVIAHLRLTELAFWGEDTQILVFTRGQEWIQVYTTLQEFEKIKVGTYFNRIILNPDHSHPGLGYWKLTSFELPQ